MAEDRKGGSYRLDAENGSLTRTEFTEDHPDGNGPRASDTGNETAADGAAAQSPMAAVPAEPADGNASSAAESGGPFPAPSRKTKA